MKRRLLLLSAIAALCVGMQGADAATAPETGAALIHQGRISEAIELLENEVNHTPQDGSLRLLLGYAMFRSGKYDQAEEILRRGIRETGANHDSFRLLGEIAYRRGEMQMALDVLAETLRLDPTDQEAQALADRIRREWQVEEKMASDRGGNFTVTYEGGGDALGHATLQVLEEAYAELGALFQLWPERPTVVILYGNRDFREVIGAPDWSGGLYDGKIRVPVAGIDGMTPQLRAVLYHEYTHVLIHSLAGKNAPLWLNEGLAQAMEELRPDHKDQLCALSRRGELLALAKFAKSLKGLSQEEIRLAYAQSRSLVAYLLDQNGLPTVVDLLRALGRGVAFDQAAAGTLQDGGGSLQQLLEDWQTNLCTEP